VTPPRALLAALLAAALAAAAPAQEPVLTADGARISRADLLARARAARLVFVGEEHGTRSHHRLQRDVLVALAEAGPAVLACEYFPGRLQPVLDRFNRGELPLDELPAAVDWERTWGHPWPAYRPLFAACRAHGVPVVAANAERALVRRVRQAGLAGLELEELLRLPRMELGVAAHRERVLADLQEVHPLPPDVLERYYQAFTLWDEAMAAATRDVLARDRRPDLRVLVVAGRAHVEGATGLPDRVARRVGGLPRLTVVCGEAPPGAADVVFGPAPTPADPARPRRWF